MVIERVIIGSGVGLQTPTGRYLLAWEQALMDRIVADRFGYHALQLGWPAVQALRANRMPHRWVMGRADEDPVGPVALAPERMPRPGQHIPGADAPFQPLPISVLGDFDALPFPAQSLDLVVLPHTLERADDPHHTLREVERVLVSEGRVVVLGFNPASLWGLQRQGLALLGGLLPQREPCLPWPGETLGPRRLRDWLRLLGFEIEEGGFGCYRPALCQEPWLARCAGLDHAGERWWPYFGGVYWMVAVKRVRGMRLLGATRRQRRRLAAAPAVVAQRGPHG